jgi:hypothetical protein
VALDLGLEVEHLAVDPEVLLRDAIRGIDLVEHVLHRTGSKQDPQRRRPVRRGVEGDETPLEGALRALQVDPCDLQLTGVYAQVVLDRVQLVGRRVVGLDRTHQTGIELLDLTEDVLHLALLGPDRRGVGGGPERRSGRARAAQRARTREGYCEARAGQAS